MRRTAPISLGDRVSALQRGVEIAAGRLPSPLIADAQQVLVRAGERSALSGAHTVVAFAGATGSGKSSLFNAVAGLDLARVGVRRPTTASALACVWGPEGAGPLLDWLGIPTRHQVARESALDAGSQGDLTGLVLLDLPDHDSTELTHRVEVDRVVALVDLLVWVVDPQKYADEVLHAYLRRLASHSDVMVVVLNHIDKLSRVERERCLTHLQQLLTDDGLAGVPVLATSAVTGAGVEELRGRLRKAVSERHAAAARTTADLVAVASRLRETVDGPGNAAIRDVDRERLVSALAVASGVPAVVDAVEHAYTHRAHAVTGWPLVRWVGRLRPDPLKRLRVDRRDVAPELLRSSLPAATPAQRAAAATAVRSLLDSAVTGAPRAVAQSVQAVTRTASQHLPDRLDRAVASTDLEGDRVPWWWRLLGTLQWLGFAALVLGAGWLLVLGVGTWVGVSRPDTPSVRGVAWPVVLALGGLLAGLLLAWVGRVLSGIGARRAAGRAERRLKRAVAVVADEVVVEPVRRELGVLDELRSALARASG